MKTVLKIVFPQVTNNDVCVLVRRGSEELQLTLGKEFLREQSRTGITKVKWFLHSLEKVAQVQKEEGKVNVEAASKAGGEANLQIKRLLIFLCKVTNTSWRRVLRNLLSINST